MVDKCPVLIPFQQSHEVLFKSSSFEAATLQIDAILNFGCLLYVCFILCNEKTPLYVIHVS